MSKNVPQIIIKNTLSKRYRGKYSQVRKQRCSHSSCHI